MAKKPLILDHSEYDLSQIVADTEEIHRYNPQRYEMAQLTAICYEDLENGICVGYKDMSSDDFWVRGHMPGLPIMPGVIMCEAGAQVASYYALKHRLMDTKMIGYGGLEGVRFRGVVRPGDRFVIVVRLLKVRRLMLTCEFQCFVDEDLVCEGILKGIPLPVDELMAEQA
ncbi:MAG: beta-hydroxyacyl-ACP dehydratase [Pirellulales bacterium]|nr:beta-hydroxyacyl-ACP dehydratase [Pirellulales bacterium]